MPTCIVCLDTLKDPAALPCGHVFCYQCIIRLIRSITPYTPNHFCPTCRQQYTISNVEPNLVPYHLRPFITPSVRKLQLEYTLPTPSPSQSTARYETLLAENASLKTCCAVWRKRAAVHAAATLGLVGLARLARDYGLKMKKDHDELEAKYTELQSQYDAKTFSPETPPVTPPPPGSESLPSDVPVPASPRDEQLRAGSPPCLPCLPHISELDLSPIAEAHLPPSLTRARRYRPLSPALFRRASSSSSSPSPSEESFYSDCSECTGDADRKRKRDEDEDEDEREPERPIKRSHSTSPDVDLAPTPVSPERAIASYLDGSLAV